MATYTKLSSGSWRVQVRRSYVSETFLRRDDACRWATETERQIDRGETPTKSRIARLKTFGELIDDLHIDHMCDVGKSPRRSKAAALAMLQRHLGKCNIAALDRERLIRLGRDRIGGFQTNLSKPPFSCRLHPRCSGPSWAIFPPVCPIAGGCRPRDTDARNRLPNVFRIRSKERLTNDVHSSRCAAPADRTCAAVLCSWRLSCESCRSSECGNRYANRRRRDIALSFSRAIEI